MGLVVTKIQEERPVGRRRSRLFDFPALISLDFLALLRSFPAGPAGTLDNGAKSALRKKLRSIFKYCQTIDAGLIAHSPKKFINRNIFQSGEFQKLHVIGNHSDGVEPAIECHPVADRDNGRYQTQKI